MKRWLTVLFVAGMVSNVWGQNVSFGFGAFMANDFGGGFEQELTYKFYNGNPNYGGDSWVVHGTAGVNPMAYFGGGGFVFFDLTYAELSLGFLHGGGEWESKEYYRDNNYQDEGIQTSSKNIDFSFSSFNIGFLGKYPFNISEKVRFFPLLGFDYQKVFFTTIDNQTSDTPDEFNQFYFKFGGGFDFEINKGLYCRFEVLYGIRAATNLEKAMSQQKNDMWDSMVAAGYDQYYDYNQDTFAGHGFTLKLAVGYKIGM